MLALFTHQMKSSRRFKALQMSVDNLAYLSHPLKSNPHNFRKFLWMIRSRNKPLQQYCVGRGNVIRLPSSSRYEMDEELLLDTEYMQSAIFALPISASSILAMEFLVEFYQEHGFMNTSLNAIRDYTKFKTRKSTRRMLAKLVDEGFLVISENLEPLAESEKGESGVYYYQLTKAVQYFFERESAKKKIHLLERQIKLWFLTKTQKGDLEQLRDEMLESCEKFYASYLKVKKQVRFFLKKDFFQKELPSSSSV